MEISRAAMGRQDVRAMGDKGGESLQQGAQRSASLSITRMPRRITPAGHSRYQQSQVEVRGIEPLSEPGSTTASTCVSR